MANTTFQTNDRILILMRFILTLAAMVGFSQLAVAQSFDNGRPEDFSSSEVPSIGFIDYLYAGSIEVTAGPVLDGSSPYFVGYSTGVYTTHGVWLNALFLGVGTGFRYTNVLHKSSYYYKDTIEKYVRRTIPLYLRVSSCFGESSIRLLLSFDSGAEFILNENESDKNGMFFFCEPAVGASFLVNKRTSIISTLGWGSSFGVMNLRIGLLF